MTRRPRNRYARYHAHVYFDADTVAHGETLCRHAGERFGIRVGRVHRRPIGPHPRWSCQLSFGHDEFDAVIGWLEAERDGLDVLVHGVTGNDLADHTEHAAWLGEPVTLDVSVFDDHAARPSQEAPT